ncbi:MAG: motility associated factor glycosyltransferase family protein [Opitutales bacterium]
MSSIWDKNLSALKARFPEMHQRTQTAPSSSAVKWESSVLIYQDSEKRHPYGSKEPSRVIDSWARRNPPLRDDINWLTGFGDGFHVRQILKNISEIGRVCVTESRIDEFRTVCENKDLTDIFNDPRFLFSGGSLDQGCFSCLQDETYRSEMEWKHLPFTPLQNRDPNYYADAKTQFGNELFLRKNIYLNRSDHSEGFLATRIINQPYTLDAPDLSALEGKFSDLPFILVAAGPSLDKSYDFLKRIQDKAIIACGNSSYSALMANGITPHITVAVDFRGDTDKGYRKHPTDKPFLFCSSYVAPAVLPRFAGRTFAWASENDPLDLVRQRLGHPKRVQIIGEGTLTTSMIQIASILGCQKVCLVAQDLGYPASGQTHTSESFYAEEERNSVEIGDCDTVPGNTTPHVYQDGHMRLYQRAVENRIETLSHLEVINTSVDGAKIKGTLYLNFDDATQWVGSSDSSNVFDTLADSCKVPDDIDSAAARFDIGTGPTEKYAQKVLDTALDLALSIEALPETFERANYFKNKNVQNCIHKSETLNQLATRHPLDHGTVAEGRARPLLLEFSELQKQTLSSSQHGDILLKNKEFAWALAEGAFFVLNTIRETRKKFQKLSVAK